MQNRTHSLDLLQEHIDDWKLRFHCRMVACAMEAYGHERERSPDEIDEWWTAGLLHDLDWESHPDDHPQVAVEEILPEHDYPPSVIQAVEAHAPDRTGVEPESSLDRHLYACDELTGFMKAVSLVRPNEFEDMRVDSVTKKLDDSSFAKNVPRDMIYRGAELIDRALEDHIQFLIDVFREKDPELQEEFSEFIP